MLGGSRAVGQQLTRASAVNRKILLFNGCGHLGACCFIGEAGIGFPLMDYFVLINAEFQLLLYGAIVRPIRISTQSTLFFTSLNNFFYQQKTLAYLPVNSRPLQRPGASG